MPDADNTKLIEIQVSLTRIETQLSERDSFYKEAIIKNSKNIGECFEEMRKGKNETKEREHVLENEMTTQKMKSEKLDHDFAVMRQDLNDVKLAVQALKISMAKISFFASLATAAITAAIVKFFAG
jgi:hypothetical protein